MKKFLLLTGFVILAFFTATATHNRAGEISYTWKGGLTYEVVITTYTKESALADRCELTLMWGDNTASVLVRENGPTGSLCPPPARVGQSLGGDVKVNIYRGQHTYQAPGFYTVALEDLNRNESVANIPFSVTVPFYITSVINVNPALGTNSSPTLLNPPIDDGCTNRKFVHNPGAYDADGDSLGYSLVNCRGQNGQPILETYGAAYVQVPVRIDSVTGDFIWDTPQNIGQYNFAILITEYRKGPNGIYQIIGSMTRDMQIDIKFCNNQPPIINPVGPFCVLANENLQFTVSASDPNNDPITLTATGGPLEVSPVAQFAQPTVGNGFVQQVFSWTPACNQVRKQPYSVLFRVEDNPPQPNEPNLVAYQTVDILVIAPAPDSLQAVPAQDAIDLSWNISPCTNAIGYDIYRKEGNSGYIPDSCETGVPGYTGYRFLAKVNGVNTRTYIDKNNLKQGVQYCYMVVAVFADGAESQASNEACTELRKSLPILTHVDVVSTSATAGSLDVKWVAPREFDSAIYPPPYEYGLERAVGLNGSNFVQIASLNSLTDTFFTDNNLNTQEQGYSYRVAFYSGLNRVLVGTSAKASSVFLDAFPVNQSVRLTYSFNVPWQNSSYIIYREQTPGSGIFDSIAQTSNNNYTDTGLVNGQDYCYKVTTVGAYSGSNLPQPLINRSQIACAAPLDTVGPCAPKLSFTADCILSTLVLSWTNPTDSSCDNTITSYNIYYKPTPDAPWPATPLVANIPVSTQSYTLQQSSIVGCYAVAAVDDASPPNIGSLSNQTCLEGCAIIKLPNVFSPNGSGTNDFFSAVRDANGNPLFKDIESFTLQIFNRWGSVVYETSDEEQFINIGWDGRDQNSGKDCAEGVYFYIFRYTPKALEVLPEVILNGSITVFR